MKNSKESLVVPSVPLYRSSTTRSLISRICLPGKVYPWVSLGPKSIDEVVLDLVDDALKLLPSCTEYARAVTIRRLLKLIHEIFPITSDRARERVEALSEFDPTYQWMDSGYLYGGAALLLSTEPMGHA